MNHNWEKLRNTILKLRDVATIGATDIAASGISAIFWFYMALILGARNYGEISYFLAIAGIASTLSLLGSNNTMMVYTAKNVKIQSPVYFLVLISGSITSVVLFLIFYNLGLSMYVLGAVIFGVASSEILGLKLYKSYSTYVIGQRILMLVLGIGLYYLMGSGGVILGIGLAYFPYFIRMYKAFRESKIDFSILKPRFGFMMNSYVLNLAGGFSGSIDKLVIAPILGYILLGNYQLGIQFLAVLQILPSIIYKYILPQDAKGIPNKNLKNAMVISSIGLSLLGILLSPVVIPPIFPKYTEAIGIIQILSVSLIPYSMSVIYDSKFLGNEKIKILFCSSAVYISVQVISIIILGKLFGINGVAWAFVLSVTSQTIFFIVADKYVKSIRNNS